MEVSLSDITKSFALKGVNKKKMLEMGFEYSIKPSFENHQLFPSHIIELIREEDDNFQKKLRLIISAGIEWTGRKMIVESIPSEKRYKTHTKRPILPEEVVPLLNAYMERVTLGKPLLDNLVNIYHETFTTFNFNKKSKKESTYFVIAPSNGEPIEEEHGKIIIPESIYIETKEKEVPISLAEKLIEMDEPRQIYKLPTSMPASSTDNSNGFYFEYQRRRLKLSERDNLCEMIRKRVIPFYE